LISPFSSNVALAIYWTGQQSTIRSLEAAQLCKSLVEWNTGDREPSSRLRTQDNAYRNWGIHCKSPDSPITSAEIAIIVANWKALESHFYCQQCLGVLQWKDPVFRCECGTAILKKDSGVVKN
jgi:hypothetical protein